MMNHITVLFFATLRDRIGTGSLMLEIPSQTTVAHLRDILDEKFPSLQGLVNHSLVAVDREFTLDEYGIPDGAEVALFPAVSGG